MIELSRENVSTARNSGGKKMVPPTALMGSFVVTLKEMRTFSPTKGKIVFSGAKKKLFPEPTTPAVLKSNKKMIGALKMILYRCCSKTS
jgi:hypothetical protein